jgi:hypothetical protein
MKNQFEEIEVGSAALTYMCDAMSGWHLLSRSLLNVVRGGRITTFLPRGVSIADLTTFTEGGKLPAAEPTSGHGARSTPIPNADAILVNEIHSFVRANTERICVIEDALTTIDDPYVQEFTDILICEGRIYHFVTSSSTPERIMACIRDARTVLDFVGALTVLPPNLFGVALGGRHKVIASDIENMAQNATCVFVGAYDGESFLKWTKIVAPDA